MNLSNLKRRFSRAAVLGLLTAIAVPVVFSTRLVHSALVQPTPIKSNATSPKGSTSPGIAERYGDLPLRFEPNEGQTDQRVKFLSRGPGYDLFLTATGAVLTLRKPQPRVDKFKQPASADGLASPAGQQVSILRLKMIGASPKAQIEGRDELPGKVNYLIGDNQDKWRTNIPTYLKVHYTEIYRGIDLVYYGNRTELEYDFVVAPGASLRAIKFQFEGAERISLDDAGNLHLAVEQDEVTLRKPVIYQLSDQGDRREVKGAYVLKGREVGFKVKAFDRRKPLIIDPVLSYSTLLGGGGHEYASGIAVDSSGNAYVTGISSSGGFPTTPGAFQTTGFGGAFVSKLDATGSNLIYSTYLSGSRGSTGTAIAVDSSGHAYVTGHTSSDDFPSVNPLKTKGSFFKTTDAAANWNNNNTGLSADINSLAVAPSAPSTIYAGTFLGPYLSTNGGATWQQTPTTGLPSFPGTRTLAVDPTNPLIVYAGMANGGLYKTTNGGNNWGVVTLPLNGATVFSIVFDPSAPSTIYLGSGNGVFRSTDNGNNWTQLNNFGIPGTPNVRALVIDPATPTTIYAGTFASGLFKTTNGGNSWTAMNNGMSGNFAHYVTAISIDPLNPSTVYAGHGYAFTGGSIDKSTDGGSTWSPVNTGVPNYEISALIVDPLASATVYAATTGGGVIKTINGGNSWTVASAGLWNSRVFVLVRDPTNSSVFYAGTDSTDGEVDAFVSKLNPAGSGLVFSTYLGGSLSDHGYGIALDPGGNVYVTGETNSTNFPAVSAFQSTFSASEQCPDGFVTKLNLATPAFVFSTYLGGNGCDSAFAIAADSSGNAYVTGSTGSTNFPVANAFQSTIAEQFFGRDAFASKFNANGTLNYSTYLGGNGNDTGYGIAVDSSGSAHITGTTASTNFPTAAPLQPTYGGSVGDAFVTKLTPSGSGLVYSTYLGGNDNDVGRGIAIDGAGNAFVAGFSRSANFPTVAGALRTKSPFYKSIDRGENWRNDNYGLNSDIVTTLALNPQNPSTIYAGTRGGVYRSTDGGSNWFPTTSGLTRPSVIKIVVDPITPSTVYLGLSFTDFNNSTGVYKSTDGGNSWNAANTGLTNTEILSLAIDPVTPSTLYAGVYGTGIFKSINSGATWTRHGSTTLSFIVTIAVDPQNPMTVYAGGTFSNGGVFKSTDGGITWQSFSNGLTSQSVISLEIDPATPSTLYAAVNGGFCKSENAGNSWRSINADLTNNFVRSIAIDPLTPLTVYVGTSRGVFKSTNGGDNWSPVNQGLEYRHVSSILVNPITPAIIYTGVNVSPPDDDAFVAKINSAGNSLIYSTLLGGSPAPNDSSNVNDEAFAIAVDSGGNAYIAGLSSSPNFPTTPDSYQPFIRGFSDSFIAKLTMSYVIGGQVLDGNNAPVSGAEVTLSDGVSLRSIFTESNGFYQFTHLREGGSFTVSAAKPHFTMTPQSQSFNNLTSNQTVNFTATATSAPFYTINGTVTNNGVGLSGVTITLSGSQAGLRTSDANGHYSFTLAGGGSYTVTPSMLGFTFTPPSQTFINLGANQTADFIATRQNFVVTNANNHGTGSLRQAILDANAIAGPDTIVFNIAGAGVHIINLLLGLPEITDPVVIDAATQPGYAGTPLVELNGDAAGSNASGFSITAGGSTIRGFVINRFNNYGILLSNNGGNVIQGNYIGIDSTGTGARGNRNGILISNSSNNIIGGTTSSARNVISSSGFDGINIIGSGNQITGNFIGTNAAGTAALGNGISGVEVSNVGGPLAANNVIGGTVLGAGNLISGNQTGIRLNSSRVLIQGNLIGTDVSGTLAVGNATGIISSTASAFIGGTVPGARNVISGNTGDGLYLGGSGSRVEGNLIGTDITGTIALGNGGSGVVAGNGVLIGGTTPEARNVISGNGAFGNISLGSNSSGHQAIVQGNYIGTDVTGNVALSNPRAGISITGSSNLIGGLVPGAQNIISGNQVGIQIGGSSTAASTGNTIQGNLIGLNALGTAALPNSQAGIHVIDSFNNTIGGDENGAANRISFNGGPGVNVFSGTGNTVRRNAIFSNANLGIDLSPLGVTANDVGDADAGANNLQNFPLLTSVTSDNSTTTIQGTLNSTPNTTFRIDFYSNLACDPLGNGEGAQFMGTTTVTTAGDGNAVINSSLPVVLATGRVVTATATSPLGSTSEFSPCNSSEAAGSVQFSSATYSVLEDVVNATITVIRIGGSKGTLSVNYSTANITAIAGLDYSAVSGTLVFADGELNKTFTIPITNDGLTEPAETLRVALSGFTNLETMGTQSTATVTIQDDSTPLVLTMNSIDVTEGDSGTTSAVVTASLSAATGRTVTANFSTLPGTATSGIDFTPVSGSLSFAPGVSEQTINVIIIGDSLNEANETFQVVLANPTNATVASSAIVRIINDDPLPTLSISDISISEGNNGSVTAVLNVSLSTASGRPVSVSYATANGTGTEPSDYTATAGRLTFNPGETVKGVSVQIVGDTNIEPDETFLVNLSFPSNATISDTQGIGTILNDDGPGGSISFSQSNYSVGEGDGLITITVNRTNDLSGSATVDYATSDDSGSATVVPCSTANGIASSRCDFTTALGTLRFAAGEGSKTFTVLISQDNYVEGPEALTLTLSNPTGTTLASPSTSILTITDDAAEPSTNPIDVADSFVRQHYHDFLNREPDAAGLAFWSDQITSCGTDTACTELRRINVSAAFFLSIEFQQTGYLVYRMYKAAHGNLSGTPVPVRLNEFLPDTQQIARGVVVGQTGWEQVLENNKQAFAADFVARARFTNAYPTTLTPTEFVNALFTNAGVTPSDPDREAAINEFGTATDTTNAAARARALRRVSENSTLAELETNRAFVLMQYFGYLRRNPNDAPEPGLNFDGYNFWLGKLNDFNGNYINAQMVEAFITSIEYKLRFGPE